ncbi:hypothetical protein JCM33374_g2785 [Metschnikowia sp. JCM 33374]|nr:hypothetical protein JCM33374_g2785 [Metschnikowia sp. JCM 33374]
MMIINGKHEHNPTLTKKPMRFNLGGLIKKKITWKKSIDALASSFHDVQLDYNQDDEESSRQGHSDAWNISSPEEHFPSGYTSYSPEQPLRHQSSSLDLHGQSFAAQEDRYTACHTECISLSNSEMTSAMTYDDNDQDSLGNSDLIFSLSPMSLEEEPIPYDASLEESIADYKDGGYHPVKIGDKYTSDLNRYKIVHKLGWGHFSTVWLCVSLMTGEYVAMKIVKSGSNYSEAARDEINILKILQGQDEDDFDLSQPRRHNIHIVSLLDNFQITGPNGTHLAMVFELMGENLLHLVYDLRAKKLALGNAVKYSPPTLLPMTMVKSVMKQILQSVHYMHQRGIIHTDLKPENILLTHNGDTREMSRLSNRSCSKFQILPSEPHRTNVDHLENVHLNVKIADLGNATHSHVHFTNNIQTRQYRAPEVVLKYKSWGASADIWSIGCLAFELLTGDYLFEPKDGTSFSKDDDHLAQIIELIGHFPSKEYLSNCKLAPSFFKDSLNMRKISSLKFWPLKNVLVEKYKFDPRDDDVNLLCDFISKCLKYDLNERYDCGSLLAHPWFKENAKYNKCECDTLPNHNRNVLGFTCEE